MPWLLLSNRHGKAKGQDFISGKERKRKKKKGKAKRKIKERKGINPCLNIRGGGDGGDPLFSVLPLLGGFNHHSVLKCFVFLSVLVFNWIVVENVDPSPETAHLPAKVLALWSRGCDVGSLF